MVTRCLEARRMAIQIEERTMNDPYIQTERLMRLTRRQFFGRAAQGVGAMALTSLSNCSTCRDNSVDLEREALC